MLEKISMFVSHLLSGIRFRTSKIIALHAQEHSTHNKHNNQSKKDKNFLFRDAINLENRLFPFQRQLLLNLMMLDLISKIKVRPQQFSSIHKKIEEIEDLYNKKEKEKTLMTP
ncbi:hypothetical protein ACJX0J_037537 [Zea mays]